MRLRLLNVLASLGLISSTPSCVLSRVKGPPLLTGGVLPRLDEEARAYRERTGALPVWGTDLPVHAVQRLQPFPKDFSLEFVRFHPSPDGNVVIEWRPPGKPSEWMWAKLDGHMLFTAAGPYRGAGE